MDVEHDAVAPLAAAEADLGHLVPADAGDALDHEQRTADLARATRTRRGARGSLQGLQARQQVDARGVDGVGVVRAATRRAPGSPRRSRVPRSPRARRRDRTSTRQASCTSSARRRRAACLAGAQNTSFGLSALWRSTSSRRIRASPQRQPLARGQRRHADEVGDDLAAVGLVEQRERRSAGARSRRDRPGARASAASASASREEESRQVTAG